MINIAIRALILFSAIALFLIGCVNAPSEQSGPGKKRDPNAKIKIGFAMDTLKEERWNRDKDLFEKHAKELGAEPHITVADNSDSKQANQVDDLLTQGVDVLVIAPHNAQTAASMVAKAKAQGVPVISYDRLINSDDLALYVSHQVTRIGQMQAEYAIKNAPSGNYVMVYGASTDNNALLLKEAQLKVLKPYIDRGDIKLIAEQHATDWRREEALKIVENALTQSGNKIAAVVASNDGTASGAVAALEKVGLAGKVVVTGQDAELAALQLIAEGKQTMTIYKPIQPLAYGAVEAAIKLAKGEKTDSNASLKAVNKEIPSLLFDPQVVDINNIMQTVVKDGYHKIEDIYKNVPKK